MAGEPTFWTLTAGDRQWVGAAGGTPPPDQYGTRWYVESESGFRDGEEPDVEILRKPGADGSWEGPITYPGKLIQLSGWFEAPNQEAMYASMEYLRGYLVREPRRGDLVVGDLNNTRPKMLRVRRGGPLVFSPFNERMGEWSMSLLAPNPTIRSPQAKTVFADPPSQAGGMAFPLAFPVGFSALGASDLVDCNNLGDKPTSPVVTFRGPCVNPRVTHTGTGRFVQVNIELFDMEELVVDFGAPSVSYVGANRFNALTSDSRFFTLTEGNNRLRFSCQAPGANARMQVTFYDTWS